MAFRIACSQCGAINEFAQPVASAKCRQCGSLLRTGDAPIEAMVVPAKKSSNVLTIVLVIAGVGLLGLIGCGGILAGLLLPAVNNAREQGRRMTCSSQARQLAQVMQMYELSHRTYPPSYTVKEGHKHSWRIMILPQLERKDLYDRYRFDEPWDGPNNRKLADEMPAFYRCPSAPSNDYSPNYFVITGPGAVFDGDKAQKSDTITNHDGMSNTLMIVEAVNTGIHWMEPRDLSMDDVDQAFDVKAGKFISSYHRHGANVVFCDSRAAFMSDETDKNVIRALITYNGHEQLRDDQIP